MEAWIIFALLAAVSAAVVRLLMEESTKKASDNAVVFSKYFFSILPALVILYFVGIPVIEQEFYYSILVAVIFDVIGITLMTKSLREDSFAHSVPLLSFTPVFLIITGYLFLREVPTISGFIGILIVVLGAYLLRYKKGHLLKPFKLLWKDKGSKHMLGTAICFSFTGVFFKKSILASSPFFTIVITLILSSLILLIFNLIKGNRDFWPNKNNFRILLVMGSLGITVLVFIFLALESGLAAYAASIKRLSILFNIIIGGLFFKEKHLAKHAVGGGVMILGALLIALG